MTEYAKIDSGSEKAKAYDFVRLRQCLDSMTHLLWGGGNGSNPADVADANRGHMHADGFDDILMEFAPAFDCTKPLCRELRNILFPLTKAGKLES